MTNLKASLVVATLGRVKEVRELLVSLSQQTVTPQMFEVIIVDQNENNILEQIVLEFRSLLNINHQRVTFKGLARAKNFGIAQSKNVIISFPDDDCIYYSDTLERVFFYFDSYPARQLVYGTLFDRALSINIMRNWLKKPCRVNYLNFPKTYCAITLFMKNYTQPFDEEFGVGTKYGVGEELDYLFQSIKDKKINFYEPNIQLWHPELNPNTMTEKKVYYYAYGYGAVIRKHCNLPILVGFLLSCSYQLYKMVGLAFLNDRVNSNKRWLAFRGRLVGFFDYK